MRQRSHVGSHRAAAAVFDDQIRVLLPDRVYERSEALHVFGEVFRRRTVPSVFNKTVVVFADRRGRLRGGVPRVDSDSRSPVVVVFDKPHAHGVETVYRRSDMIPYFLGPEIDENRVAPYVFPVSFQNRSGIVLHELRACAR